ncbi:SDR family NAD(P)-dependent oxidoreductase [Parageobacillus thermoglucosidasius]|uniref:SDR family NAD(P)-dependent oxidoreductase n=1 Tax=Parageobacillus thermoglucosidasius TaxID=1426 RepID=UPI00241C0652|nr:SDR family oxidoreductase [Parageobacillus thermoglucosidasius]
MRTNKLTGKTAIVTGGGRGIGRGIALRLAQEGADVLIADLSEEHARQTVEEIAKQSNVSADYFVGDLSLEESAVRMVEKTIANWGKVDILVNNAGGGIILPFLEHTPDTLRTTIERNLWTVIWGCRAVLPHMVARRYGRIINIGADSVRSGLWGHAAYNGAKGGVHGLTTGLAREFCAYNITVNTVAPCAVATETLVELEKTDPDMYQKFVSVIPQGRPAEVQEVANVVSFIASDEASFINGQVISVNGGTTMP